jgi:hypothetical protein
VWADYTIADFASERDNQFRVRASGGARFDVNSSGWVNIYSQSAHGASVLIDTSTGAYLTTGGVWTDTSDRNAKENWAPVDGQATLARLAQLPIGTWNYKAEDPSVRRMGPTAQDFYAAFGLGGDEKAIGTVDADGVAMAAIQGLYDISQAQAGRIEVLEAETASQQAQIDELEARLGALEKRAADPASPLTRLPGAWLLLGGMVLVAGVVVQRRLPGGGR